MKRFVFQPGERVRHKSGRTAVVVKDMGRHNGIRVKFDGPKANRFEPDETRVYKTDVTPVDPKRHAAYEAKWAEAPFVDRAWATSRADQ